MQTAGGSSPGISTSSSPLLLYENTSLSLQFIDTTRFSPRPQQTCSAGQPSHKVTSFQNKWLAKLFLCVLGRKVTRKRPQKKTTKIMKEKRCWVRPWSSDVGLIDNALWRRRMHTSWVDTECTTIKAFVFQSTRRRKWDLEHRH